MKQKVEKNTHDDCKKPVHPVHPVAQAQNMLKYQGNIHFALAETSRSQVGPPGRPVKLRRQIKKKWKSGAICVIGGETFDYFVVSWYNFVKHHKTLGF